MNGEKNYTLDIVCADREVAKNVEAGIRFAGSGTYSHPDDLTFTLRMNPMHVPLICAVCQRMAQNASILPEPVSFWHLGEKLS